MKLGNSPSRRAILISAGLIAFVPRFLTALDPATPPTRYHHEVWDERQGLDHRSVNAVFQSQEGYLWLGTYYGLVRFDGIQFTAFEQSNTPQLRSNAIWAFAENQEGLWIATSAGLTRLSKGVFTTYGTERGLPDSRVRALAAGRNGRLWVGTSAGLAVRDRGGLRPYALENVAVRALLEDRSGRLWVGSTTGLYRLTSAGWSILTTANGLPDNRVLSLEEDSDGGLWIGTTKGLCRYVDGHLTRFDQAPGIAGRAVWTLLEDRDHNLWIGSLGGGLIRHSAGRFEPYTDRQRLSSQMITALFEDSEGNLWIGADGGGLSRLRDVSFTTWDVGDGLGANVIQTVLGARGGDLWIGTNGGGLSRLRDGKIANFTVRDGLSSDAVWALIEARDGAIWAGTFGGGVNRFHNGRFERITTADGLSRNDVFSLLEDRNGDIWVGTFGGGADRIRNGRVVAHYTMNDGLPANDVRAIFEDRRGRLWFGTGGGLSLFENGAFRTWCGRDGLSDDLITSIGEDDDGTMWIGTFGGGINRWKDGRFTPVGAAQGLVHDSVFRALDDGLGYLWLSTARGIARVRKSDVAELAAGRIARIPSAAYDISDGLKSRECNSGQPAAFRTADGKLWFATMQGLAVADPRRLVHNRVPPAVAIERVLVENRELPLGGRIEIPAASRRIEIHFTGFSFAVPSRVRFRYKLDGLQDEWEDIGDRRRAYFTHMPPGSYRFLVTAANNDGVWNETGVSLEFTVRPAFYQTAWFRALSGVCVILLAGAVYVLRTRQLVRRNRALEQRVSDRTRELAEANQSLTGMVSELQSAKLGAERASRAKSEFVANISHEIRTPMNGILGMTTLALRTELTSEQREYLELAQVSARSLLALLNDVLDFSKADAGRMPLNLADFEVAPWLDAVVKPFLFRARERGIALRSEIGPGVPPAVRADPVRLQQILVNLIGNALKFTERGSVTVRLDPDSAEGERLALRFTVADTGIGVPADKQKLIFEPFSQADSTTSREYGGTGLGLTICARLVALMQGRIWVKSEPGKGSEFHFTVDVARAAVPDGRANHRLSSGGSSQPMRVLLAEDNPVNRKFASVLLRQMGHSVEFAESGRQAVDMSAAAVFDVVLMDVQMPEVDGLEAARLIREREKLAGVRVPIIAMTACALDGDRERCLEAGMDGYISKPVIPEELASALSRWGKPCPQPPR